MPNRHQDLSRPRRPRRGLGIHYDPDAFGEFSEAIARNLGTARFLVIQTVIVGVWILINVIVVSLRWDPYPFILLNLFLSMLAAIQAPVIMMSQNRQDAKDRLRGELDYDVNRRAELQIQGLAGKLNLLGEQIDDVEELLRERLPSGNGSDSRPVTQ